MYLCFTPKAYFHVPTGDIKALTPTYGNVIHFINNSNGITVVLAYLLGIGCHKVDAPTEIQLVLKPFISDHQWQALCTNLGVDANQLSEMQLSYVDDSIKLETCLATFAAQEGAC